MTVEGRIKNSGNFTTVYGYTVCDGIIWIGNKGYNYAEVMEKVRTKAKTLPKKAF